MGALGDSLARFLALPLARGAGTVAGGGEYIMSYYDWRTFYALFWSVFDRFGVTFGLFWCALGPKMTPRLTKTCQNVL